MPQNKKQHYVPQFYLRRFSKDGKSINIWNISNEKKIESANLKNQCYRNYFYGKDKDFEESLSYIEGQAARILHTIEGKLLLPAPGSEDHLTLVLFVLMQHARTLHSADSINEMVDNIAKYILRHSEMAEQIDPSEFTVGLEDAARLSLSVATSCYPILLDLQCKVLVNKTTHEFVTSDNPVVLYNPFLAFRKHLSNTGLSAKGLQIIFPVGPEFILLFYDDTVYKIGNDDTYIVEVRKTNEVSALNGLQVCSALNNMYYKHDDFDIESLYRTLSEWRVAQKTDFEVADLHDPSGNRTDKLLRTSRMDIRCNVSLRFVRLKLSAMQWRWKFRRTNPQPVSIVRNEDWRDKFEVFQALISKGVYKPSEFFVYLQDYYETE
ncbi:MAG: DUF4238 domain-containing protein [Rhodospirillales bacterium]|nr:DUF4238 domain-containing protein [Rhodospirillales bacterium]